ncbi:unnamed protein product [Coregonus sp. 'balchen']|nr:unnamed protein product [Coregonus sp. 'balchen']
MEGGRPEEDYRGNHIVKHDYTKPLTYCIFRPAPPGEDVAMLARAAVGGDESALDMFNWRKAGNGAPLKMGPQEGLVFYVSTADGKVHCVDEHGRSSPVLSVDGSIQKLFYLKRREVLAVVTETLMLSQYTLGPEGGAHELMKRDDNYVLSLDESRGFEKGEVLNCVSYCTAKEILAAGTNRGRIALWRMVSQPNTRTDTKAQWKLQTPTEIEGNVTQLQWGSNLNLLAANSVTTVLILCEHVMSAHFGQQVAAVQLTPSQLSLTMFNTNSHLTLRSDMHIKGVCVTKDTVTVWNGKQVTVYETSGTTLRNTGSFQCESQVLAVHDENIYTGTVKQLLAFSEAEGNPVLLSVCQGYLVVGTDTAHIKVFDLTRREAKAHCSAKNLVDLTPNLGALRSVKCNANGNQVSILVTLVNGRPDHRMYFYDVEMDTLSHFDFFTGRPPSGISQADDTERRPMTELSERCPVSHFWDENEPRLFVCETVLVNSDSPQMDHLDRVDVLVVTFFCTQEHGLLLQDSYPKPAGLQALLALDVPYYYFTCKPGERDPEAEEAPAPDPTQSPSLAQASAPAPAAQSPHMVSRRALRDFQGLENCEKATRDAMLNFSFYLTIGNMDEAFKSIKLIKR